ncbi:3-oxocholest-4-en-26-oate--CoA ligase [subsurface metagenome]
MNTADFLGIATAICPERAAIVFEGKRYTFSQLNDRVNSLANALANLGVDKGDRVAMLQVNCNQCVETYFATAKLGAIYVPLNFRAKGDELTYMLNSSEANTLLVGERYIELANSIKPELTSVKTFISLDSQREGMLYYDDMIASSAAEEIFTEIGDDDTTILMTSSGIGAAP